MSHKYSVFTLEDFITDDSFIAWAKYPTQESDLFWNAFIAENPQQATIVTNAKNAVLALVEASRHSNSKKDAPEIWIDVNEGLEFQSNLKSIAVNWKQWAAAASIIIVLGFWWFIDNSTKQKYEYAELVQKSETELKEVTNKTKKDLSFILPDESIIVLKPNSKLSYNNFENSPLREVYLAGEAFFDVKKNSKKPFYVYSNGLVTKVLGTSFTIKAFETDKDVVVNVKTGKVTVYPQSSIINKDPETSGLVLFPNQKVVFEKTQERLSRSLVEKPVLLISTEELAQFKFNDAPVEQIFLALELAYGVEIIIDNDALKNCMLTTSLTNETLFEKLDIICGAIEAKYKIVDAQIIISSSGCN